MGEGTVRGESPIRVLIVDDEPNLRHLLAAVLTRQGWAVETAATGQAAIDAALGLRPHLIVLDIVLPDIDGIQVLRTIRADLPDTMVLFLTANGTVAGRITGISAGGDDYVAKPFSIEEVVVRLRGLLRRSPMLAAGAPTPLLEVGDLELNEDSHRVSRAGEDIVLTATEFALLRFLMLNADRVLSKDQILDRVWNYDFGRESNIVELYVSYLRKKIDRGRDPMIHTIRRVGYVLRAAVVREVRPR
ncbi:two-component system OmpR family response regulator [Microbacterium resistens]|uniref:Two-component system OmpR family response regulator n=1 Tax=Microbacterium resistens TaxID=156977 RepID=A0ABU1SCW0_9MICO|nr:response regulator transcription factor [Microbacterium resistens]MDR6867063.1 two-component system OmpR family response regulator [Microbacterium resistens]